MSNTPKTDAVQNDHPPGDRQSTVWWATRYQQLLEHARRMELQAPRAEELPPGWKMVCEKCGADRDSACGWPTNCPTQRHDMNRESSENA